MRTENKFWLSAEKKGGNIGTEGPCIWTSLRHKQLCLDCVKAPLRCSVAGGKRISTRDVTYDFDVIQTLEAL